MKIENLDSKDLEDIKRIFEKLNQSGFEYPIYKKHTKSELVVKFDDLQSGEIIIGNIFYSKGSHVSSLMPHTNSEIWQDFDPAELNKPKAVGAFVTCEHERYHSVDTNGACICTRNNNDELGDIRVSFGNCFESREKAEWASPKMRKHNRLLAWLANHDDGWVADWNDFKQRKYYVQYNQDIRKFTIDSSAVSNILGLVYMSRANAEELCRQLNSGEYVL